MVDEDTYDANVRVRDLPRQTDYIITLLAVSQNKPKWEVVRDALVEYAENHKGEIMAAVK
jgi:hypothetical protein